VEPQNRGLLPRPDEQEDDDDGAAHSDAIGDHERFEHPVVAMKGDALGLVVAAGHGEGGGEGDSGDEGGGEEVGINDTVEVFTVEGPASVGDSGRQLLPAAPFGLLLHELGPEVHLVGICLVGVELFLDEAACRLALVVADAGVDHADVVEEQQREVDAAHLDGEVQRRVAVAIDAVKKKLRGTDMAEQAPDRALIATDDGGVEGVSAVAVLHLGHIGAVPEQRLDNVRRAVLRGDVPRGLPILVSAVGQLRLPDEQQLHHVRVVLLRRVVRPSAPRSRRGPRGRTPRARARQPGGAPCCPAASWS